MPRRVPRDLPPLFPTHEAFWQAAIDALCSKEQGEPRDEDDVFEEQDDQTDEEKADNR